MKKLLGLFLMVFLISCDVSVENNAKEEAGREKAYIFSAVIDAGMQFMNNNSLTCKNSGTINAPSPGTLVFNNCELDFVSATNVTCEGVAINSYTITATGTLTGDTASFNVAYVKIPSLLTRDTECEITADIDDSS